MMKLRVTFLALFLALSHTMMLAQHRNTIYIVTGQVIYATIQGEEREIFTVCEKGEIIYGAATAGRIGFDDGAYK